MLLDPRDPAAQAFIADHMADFPTDSFEEAVHECGAYQCENCKAWFSTKDDLDEDADCHLCWECSADVGGYLDPHKEWGTWR